MSGKILLLGLFFSTFCLAPCAGLGLGLAETTALTFSKDARFAPRARSDIAGSVEIEIPLFSSPVGIGTSLGLHKSFASSLDGGYAYRATVGIDWRLYLDARITIHHGRYLATVWAGGNFGGALLVDRYEHTLLHFFYPGVFLEPYVESNLAWLPHCSLRLAVPLAAYFRRDLEYSFAAGVKLVARIHPLGLAGRT